ncbi:AraC family transcriptional regulator [Aggregatimonas sangjinii]|uniref:AraC family transcriptional regulator n=2 Tax=Aggregatimonas sangjinii TaxID=2583587 RepID=A0A5B7SZ24_9FLAO|nr:AraC family transcriptional regulator [Aggregatimonas sangjinii]
MGWYDTFRNTKINYALITLSIAIAPLIYLYVKSMTMSSFAFRKKDWLHFLPVFTVILYRIIIFSLDALEPGFAQTQNGYLKINLDEPYFLPVYSTFSYIQNILYLAFTVQLFYNYRKKINEYFSNTFKLELNWIRNFLLLYIILFLYDIVQTIIGTIFMDLNYRQRWWMTFFTGLVIIYVGIKGFFTNTSKLKKLDFSFSPKRVAIPENASTSAKTVSPEAMQHIKWLMEEEKPYLNPELDLSDLAKAAKLTRGQLSEIINSGFGQNFNDFVNGYRVEAFKNMLSDNKHQQLSILGIAYECGFNSKATFNRVFKKITHSSPSEFLKTFS